MSNSPPVQDATLTAQQYQLRGEINLATFRAQRTAGEEAIRASSALPGKTLRIDFSQVETANSLGVALMTAWFRFAQTLGCQLQIAPLPRGLEQIVEFSGLSDVLPLVAEP